MSRNWFPAIMAIGMGVFTGYYSFQPALKELQVEQGQGQRSQPSAQQDQQTPAPNTNGNTGATTDANQGAK